MTCDTCEQAVSIWNGLYTWVPSGVVSVVNWDKLELFFWFLGILIIAFCVQGCARHMLRNRSCRLKNLNCICKQLSWQFWPGWMKQHPRCWRGHRGIYTWKVGVGCKAQWFESVENLRIKTKITQRHSYNETWVPGQIFHAADYALTYKRFLHQTFCSFFIFFRWWTWIHSRRNKEIRRGQGNLLRTSFCWLLESGEEGRVNKTILGLKESDSPGGSKVSI